MIFDYSNIASKIYSRSFSAVCVFILISFGLVRGSGENIVETFKIVLTFVEHILWIYAVPVSLQIAGDKIAVVLEHIKFSKSVTVVNSPKETKIKK